MGAGKVIVMEEKKDGFGSKVGFVLAAAGSAVGLQTIFLKFGLLFSISIRSCRGSQQP